MSNDVPASAASDSNVLMISSDCHAAALPHTYNEYMPAKYREAADDWWVSYAREMITRTGTFFDQEAVEQFSEAGGEEGTGKFDISNIANVAKASDDEIRAMLLDETSPFAPRRGEFDMDVRIEELEGDGIAGEIIFPQMAPFGAGLTQYRNPVDPEYNLQGNRAYNRWLADFCSINPGRHAGVAIINVEDIEETVKDIYSAKEANLFGGILLPSGTGTHQYYHDPRYEPIWAACAEADLPIHVHGGWSPDYGDTPSATAMFISETDMWSHRVFTAMLWAGVFERHPTLKLVFTEVGSAWIIEHLRRLEFKADNPLFAHFKKDLSMSPTEYYQQNCYMGASFFPKHELPERYRIGVDKIMWGSDYPHMEGTWPHTMAYLNDVYADVDESEIRSILGERAVEVFGFDRKIIDPINARIGFSVEQIRGTA